jgi:hypothetical protein
MKLYWVFAVPAAPAAKVEQLASSGLHAIVNETVDVRDGGHATLNPLESE